MTTPAESTRSVEMPQMLSFIYSRFMGLSSEDCLKENLKEGKKQLQSKIDDVAGKALACATQVEGENARLSHLLEDLAPYHAAKKQLHNLQDSFQSQQAVHLDLERSLGEEEQDLKAVLEQQRSLQTKMAAISDTMREASKVGKHDKALFKMGEKIISGISKGVI